MKVDRTWRGAAPNAVKLLPKELAAVATKGLKSSSTATRGTRQRHGSDGGAQEVLASSLLRPR